MPGQNSFGGPDLGFITTEVMDESDSQGLSNFLNDSPDDIVVIPKNQPKETPPTPPTPTKQEVKPPEPVKGPLSADDILGKEEGDNSEEEAPEEKKEETKNEEDENMFSSIAKELFDLGIFSKDEGEEDVEIDTPEAFKERFEYEKKKDVGAILDKFLSQFGEDYNEMFTSVFVEGTKPKDYLERFVRVENISQIDISKEENQEYLLRQLYKTQGIDPQKIDSKIDRHKQYGDLEEEAKDAQILLLKKEEKDKADEQAVKQQQAQAELRMRTEYVQNVQRILNDKLQKKDFDGIPINKQFAEQIGSYITKERYQGSNGKNLTQFDKDLLDLSRPENHELKVKMAMLLNIVKSDPTLSRLTKRELSKQSSGLFSSIKKNSIKTGASKEKEEKDDGKISSWF